MSVKIPEIVILKAQQDVYDIHNEFGVGCRKVEEARRILEKAEAVLAYKTTNLKEICKFLDEVSPTGKDWNWLEEIEGSLVDEQ